MRPILTLVFILALHFVYSQSKPLDEEYGLGPFKFETPFASLETNLKGVLQISYGQNYYLYLGDDQDVFYGLKVRKVNIGFYKDKLNYIDYYFRKLDNLAFAALLEMVSQDYGIADKIIDPADDGIQESYRWKGERTYLQLIRYGSNSIDWDDRNMTVLVAELREGTN